MMLIAGCRVPIEIRVLFELGHVLHISIGRFCLLCPSLSQGYGPLISAVHLGDEVGLRQTKVVMEAGKAVADVEV